MTAISTSVTERRQARAAATSAAAAAQAEAAKQLEESKEELKTINLTLGDFLYEVQYRPSVAIDDIASTFCQQRVHEIRDVLANDQSIPAEAVTTELCSTVVAQLISAYAQ